MRALTEYMPNVGGQTSTASLPGAAEGASQEIDRLIAAASHEHGVGGDRVQVREALDQRPRLRLRVAVESGARVIVRRAPGQLVGMQPLEARLPGGVLVGLERHDVGSCELAAPSSR